jgi:hypothetical protein
MIKKKTSVVQKKSATVTSSRKFKPGAKAKLIKFSPTDDLLDEDFIARVILSCLMDNDPEGVVEVIQAFQRARSRRVTPGGASDSAMSLKTKNPSLKTLAQFVSSIK